LNFGGCLLVVAATLHFFAIPILRRILESHLTTDAYEFFAPPFFLNHSAVGILLLPLAFNSFYCARGIRRGQRWAWRIGLATALGILALPLALLAIMGTRYLLAIPFLVAALAITAAGLVMTLPLLWVRHDLEDLNPISGSS
jgi:hypothetical protein